MGWPTKFHCSEFNNISNYLLPSERWTQAPITEEIVFRACLLAIADLSGASLYHKLFITPLWFGVGASWSFNASNFFLRVSSTTSFTQHTCITLMKTTEDSDPMAQPWNSPYRLAVLAVVSCIVRNIRTNGPYSGSDDVYESFWNVCFIFVDAVWWVMDTPQPVWLILISLLSGSVIPAITAHITANIMGLPNPGWELSRYPKHKKGMFPFWVTSTVTLTFLVKWYSPHTWLVLLVLLWHVVPGQLSRNK